MGGGRCIDGRRKTGGDIQVSAANAVAVFPFLVFVILTFFPHDPDCWGELTATIQSESIYQLHSFSLVTRTSFAHGSTHPHANPHMIQDSHPDNSR